MKDYTRKNSLRLQGYDYSRAGMYFITICTKDSELMFGKVHDGKMELSEHGEIAKNELLKTSELLAFNLAQFIIMPNHVHFIAVLPEPQIDDETKTSIIIRNKQLIPKIVQAYKAAVSRKLGFSLWQRSYFDNILRSKEEYEIVKQYIESNPATWQKDKFFLT